MPQRELTSCVLCPWSCLAIIFSIVSNTSKLESIKPIKWKIGVFFRGSLGSSFLTLIKDKLDEYPVESQAIKQDLLDTVDYMLQNIDHFNSEDNIEVYGDAVQKLKHIKVLNLNSG